MRIASLVLGIIALLFSWIPLIGGLFLPLAIVGIVLGAVSVAKEKKKKKGKGGSSRKLAIAALITSIISILSIIGFTIFWATRPSSTYPVRIDVTDSSAAVIAGELQFMTTDFTCSSWFSSATRNCFLEFTVSNLSEEAEVELLASEYPALVIPYSRLVSGGNPQRDSSLTEEELELGTLRTPNSGICSDERILPGGSSTCSVSFNMGPMPLPEALEYKVSSSSGKRVRIALPPFVLNDGAR